MSSNLDTNLDILKIVGVLIVLASLGVGGYFLWKKYHIKPSCGPNQDYISACNICVNKCPEGSAYNCSQKACVCSNAQLVLNNGVCVCPDTLQPPIDGQCGTIECPNGQYSCSWDPQNCITPDGESCSFAGAVDPISGKLIDGSLVPVPCGPDKICLKVGSPEFEKYVTYNTSFKQTICQNSVCSCSSSTNDCIFQCNGQNFSGYNLKNDRCSAPVELPNCAESTLDVDGVAVCKKCALYNSDAIGIDGTYYPEFQKFNLALNDPKMGCTLNPSPWAWADLTGVSCHADGGATDDWALCGEGTQNYRYNNANASYNACFIPQNVLVDNTNNKKTVPSKYNSNITYNFGEIREPEVFENGFGGFVGPYTLINVNESINVTNLLGPNSYGKAYNPTPNQTFYDPTQSDLYTNVPYFKNIVNSQIQSCANTKYNSWGRPKTMYSSLGEDPDSYQYIRS